MINNVNRCTSTAGIYEMKEKQNTKTADITEKKDREAAVLERNKTHNSNVTYNKPKASNTTINDVNKIIKEAEKSCKGLRELVQRLIINQGKRSENLLIGKELPVIGDTAGTSAGEVDFENGEWGVKAVSDRLVDFAKAISGNDKTKVTELKNAIYEGFREAEKQFGGQLPEICSRTIDETMKKLDEWAGSEA